MCCAGIDMFTVWNCWSNHVHVPLSIISYSPRSGRSGVPVRGARPFAHGGRDSPPGRATDQLSRSSGNDQVPQSPLLFTEETQTKPHIDGSETLSEVTSDCQSEKGPQSAQEWCYERSSKTYRYCIQNVLDEYNITFEYFTEVTKIDWPSVDAICAAVLLHDLWPGADILDKDLNDELRKG